MKKNSILKGLLFSSAMLGGVIFSNDIIHASNNTTLGQLAAKQEKPFKNIDSSPVINAQNVFIASWKPIDKNGDGISDNLKLIDGKKGTGKWYNNKKLTGTKADKKDEIFHSFTWRGLPDKGNVGVGIRYINVGTYNGQQLDLIVTLDSVDKGYATKADQRGISFGNNAISFATEGLDKAKMSYKFVKSGTDTPVNLENVIFNFSDIDIFQGIEIPKDDGLQAIYADKSSPLEVSTKGSDYYIYDNSGKSNDDDSLNSKTDGGKDIQNALSLYYKNISKLTFDWCKNNVYKNDKGEIKKLNPDGNFFNEKYGNEAAAGEYLKYSGLKPVLSTILSPIKEVQDSDEKIDDTNNKLEDHNTLKNTTEQYQYRVKHYVPNEYRHYTEYVLSDDLPKGTTMDTKSIKVSQLGSNNKLKDVTKDFDVKATSNSWKVSAKKDFMDKKSFYNNTYVVTWNENPDKTTKSGDVFKNKAKVEAKSGKIDLGSHFSNETKTDVLVPKKPDIKPTSEIKHIKPKKSTINKKSIAEKSILVNGKEVKELKDQKPGTDVKYKLSFTSNQKGTKKLEYNDDLDNRLDVQDNSIKLVCDGKDVTKNFNIKVNDNEEIVDITAKEAKEFEGKTVNVIFDAKIKNDVKDKDIIPNEAKMNEDKTQTNTNKVDISVEKEKEKPTPKPTPKPTQKETPKAEKFIVNKDGKLVKEENISNKDDVNYHLVFTIPNDQKVNNLSLKDDVDNRLDVKYNSIVVKDKNGNNVTKDFIIDLDSEEEMIKVIPIDNGKWQGNQLSLDFKAKPKENIGDCVIPNEGSMKLNNHKTDTNVVQVFKKDILSPKVEKTINKMPKVIQKPVTKLVETAEQHPFGISAILIGLISALTFGVISLKKKND